jgi:hypothetical protein
VRDSLRENRPAINPFDSVSAASSDTFFHQSRKICNPARARNCYDGNGGSRRDQAQSMLNRLAKLNRLDVGIVL